MSTLALDFNWNTTKQKTIEENSFAKKTIFNDDFHMSFYLSSN